MRIIKFRAWLKQSQRMIDNALEIKNIGLGEGSVIADEQTQDGQEIEWMQFTGLTDKLGKEIYEGDIVIPISSITGKGINTLRQRKLVEWKIGTHNQNGFNVVIGKVEIIGNIYENPELLK